MTKTMIINETKLKMIKERILSLKTEKERILLDYINADDEMQTMLAMQNAQISIELKFLEELKEDSNNYIIIKNPLSVKSKKTREEIKKLIKEGKKTNEIFCKIEFVASDNIIKDILNQFQVIKNTIAFEEKAGL